MAGGELCDLVPGRAGRVHTHRVGTALGAAALLAGLPRAGRAAGPVVVGLLLDDLHQRRL
jgi:hypothetical protein